MASNLLDTIRQNSQSLQTQPVAEDQTQRIQQLLRAKSGKAVAGGPAATSNLGEQQANVQSAQQLGQVAQQANVAQQGQQVQEATQNQKVEEATQEVGQARQLNTLQNKVKTDQILGDLERSKGEIDVNRQNAALEQVGTNLRLQNSQYIDQLKNEGTRARLQDAASFNDSLAKSIFQDQASVLQEQLGNKSILDATDREYNRLLSKMDVETAYEVFKQDQKTKIEKARWEGFGSVIGMGAGAL